MSYFESRIRLDFKDFYEIIEIIRFCEQLGITQLILEPITNFKNFDLKLKESIENSTKINIIFRFNLKPNSTTELKRKLKIYNRFPYILSLESSSKNIQTQAAKDSRIDIVSFSDCDILKTLTPGVISLIKQNNSFIEFSLSPVMLHNKSIQSKNFRILYKYIHLALKSKVNVLISGNFDHLYDLRNPRVLVSICHTLLDIPLNLVKKMFDKNPRLLLNRVKNRQNLDYIENGLRIIQR